MENSFIMPSYTYTIDNLHIIESYKVSKHDFSAILSKIHEEIGDACRTFLRCEDSLIAEWGVHNILYRLGLFRSRTADADLNVPQKYDCLYRTLWTLFSWLAK